MSGCRAIAGQSASSRTTCRCAGAASGSRSSSACCVTSTGGAGVGQHERQPLARIVRVERQIGAAGLEDAEQARPPSRASAPRTARPWSRARRRGFADDAPGGWRGRRARRSSARGPRRSPRWRPACAEPARQTAPARSRRGIAGRQPANARCRSRAAGWCRARPASRIDRPPSAPLRIGNRGLQQPHQPPPSASTRRPLEQVGPVVEPQLQLSPGCTISASG